MKCAVLSDIHANLEAFLAVLADARACGVEAFAFGGDIVGYGADPVACLETLRGLQKSHECYFVVGNHDLAVANLMPYENYNVYAKEAIEWTKKQMLPAHIEFLSQMSIIKKVEKHFMLVHANLVNPLAWGYVTDIDEAFPNFHIMSEPICFIGHSHKPLVFEEHHIIDWFIEDLIKIEPQKKYIINVGSVGQPRDGNPAACYAIYQSDPHQVEIRRVPYPVETTQEKIIRAGLPRILAERLSVGK